MTEETIPIRRALISVSDKAGLLRLGRALCERGVEILASGGTAKALRDAEVSVREVSDFTKDPEMLDGRLKTLHPKVHGGILAVRDNPEHMRALKRHDYHPIDLVVVNLYPFEKRLAGAETPFETMIEEIDIGGPTLLRAAAKNHAFVTVLAEPEQYDEFLLEFESRGGTTLAFRRRAARRVFERTAAYDSAISRYLQSLAGEKLPEHLSLALRRKWETRYGENPHQRAGFYLPETRLGRSAIGRVLQGKELSHNNLLDVHAALDLMTDLPGHRRAAILKHANPCGVGLSDVSLIEAYERAFRCDPVSAFGGIVVFSDTVDGATAEACAKTFTEIVIAPGFDGPARDVFGKKKNLRLIEADWAEVSDALGGLDIRRAADGYLVQERDRSNEDLSEARVVTRRAPSPEEMRSLRLAWAVVKHVKSNAIVITTEFETLGVGAGQMNRVQSLRIAAQHAGEERTRGAALGSDAFFPFRDSVDEAAGSGIKAVVQPGGSVRDDEVIAAADEHGMAMLFTGVRHFKH